MNRINAFETRDFYVSSTAPQQELLLERIARDRSLHAYENQVFVGWIRADTILALRAVEEMKERWSGR